VRLLGLPVVKPHRSPRLDQRSFDRSVRSLQAVPEGGVLRLDELVGSICLQCRKFPYQRREIAGRVSDYVLRVLRTPLRQPNHLPEIR
jgi:hypothetical protein